MTTIEELRQCIEEELEICQLQSEYWKLKAAEYKKKGKKLASKLLLALVEKEQEREERLKHYLEM